DVALGLEAADGLADRHDADAEVAREAVQHEAGAGTVDAGGDAVADGVVGALRLGPRVVRRRRPPLRRSCARHASDRIRSRMRSGQAVRTELFVDGGWAAPRAEGRFDDVEPATGAVLARVARGAAEDVDAAVAAARRAAREGPWPRMG